jgi:hypothetical protein
VGIPPVEEKMSGTIRQLRQRFLALIPEESPIDREAHAQRIAEMCFEARRTAVERRASTTRLRVSEIRSALEERRSLRAPSEPARRREVGGAGLEPATPCV